MGYVDFGEEDDWGRADEEADDKDLAQEPSSKKRKDEAGQGKGT